MADAIEQYEGAGMRSVPEWQGKTDDSAIPPRVRDRIARKAEDCCHKCRRSIAGKLRAEFDHVIPLIIGGKHSESNLQLLCNECHAAKSKLDVKIKVKVARVRKQHLGLKKPRTIRSWRKFNGDIVHATRDRT